MNEPLCTHVVNLPSPRRMVDILVEVGVHPDTAATLTCPDVHHMVQSIARSNYLARTERRLLLDEYPPPAPPPARVPVHRTRGFLYTLWAVAAVMFSVALFIICSPIWRTFS